MKKILSWFGFVPIAELEKSWVAGEKTGRRLNTEALADERKVTKELRSRSEKAESEVREQLQTDCVLAALKVIHAVISDVPVANMPQLQANMQNAQQQMNQYGHLPVNFLSALSGLQGFR